MTRKTAVAHFAIIVWAVLFTMVVSAQQITLKQGAIPDNEIHRTNARDFGYCEITPVFGKPPNAMALQQQRSGRPLPTEPDGKTWVMLSYTTEVDTDLTLDQLSNLVSKLKLPDGFKFEIKELPRALTIDAQRANGLAHIIRDNLHDIYQGCGFDNACNYVR